MTADGSGRLFGVTLVGVTSETGPRLLFTILLVLVVLAQGAQVVTTVVLVLGTLSIWITPDTNITTAVGLISAGLAFALQQVILSLAAYFVILRGDTFGVGARITLGGVRGDVVRLGFLKTTIMEIGRKRSEHPSADTTVPVLPAILDLIAGDPDLLGGLVEQTPTRA